MGEYSRSVSQLKGWTKCGEAFYLERFQRKNLPERPAPWTLLGIAVHDVVMAWEKSGRTLDYIEAFLYNYDELVKAAWERQPDPKLWFLPPNTKYVKKAIETYRTRGVEQLSEYMYEVERAPWEISHLEQPFEIKFGDITVKGAVDRILYYPGSDEYIIEDLKTGTPKEEEDYRQLSLYAYVAQTLWDLPVYFGRYWFTKVGRASPTYDLRPQTNYEYWERQFVLLDKAITEEIFLPSPGSGCGLCAVKPWCRSQGWLKIGESL